MIIRVVMEQSDQLFEQAVGAERDFIVERDTTRVAAVDPVFLIGAKASVRPRGMKRISGSIQCLSDRAFSSTPLSVTR